MFEHADYRDFIAELVARKKAISKHFSFQQFALRAKTSRGYLKLVIDKKRHITLDKVLVISDYFQLDEYEKYYLLFLFLQTSTEDHKLKKLFKIIITRLRFFHELSAPTNLGKTGDLNTSNFPENWVEMAVYAISTFANFKKDPSSIQSVLGGSKYASLKSIKKSLEKLSNDTKKNIYLKNLDPILMGMELKKMRDGIMRTHRAIDEYEENKDLHQPGHFQMYAISCSEEDIADLTDLYKDFNQKLIAFMNNQSNKKLERVIFISNNFFSITHKIDGED